MISRNLVRFGDFMQKSEKWLRPEPDKTYKLITLKLWGRGPILRTEVEGSQLSSSSKQHQVRAGEFLISRIDARHGASGLVPQDLDGAIVSNDFPSFEIDKNIVDPEFLEWFCKTREFVELCKRASEGSTNRVRLQEGKLLDLSLSLPTLEEQKKISSRLSAVSQRLNELNKEVERFEADCQSLIQAFHLSKAGIQEQKVSDYIELWEDRVPVEHDKSYPQVGIRSFGKGIFLKDAISGNETQYKSFNRLHDGLLVLSQPKGWEGAIAVCGETEDGLFSSPEYRTFRCKPEVCLAEYLREIAKTPWFQNKLAKLSRGQGARRERLKPDMLLNLRIAMPSLADQKIAVALSSRLSCAQKLNFEIAKLSEDVLPGMLRQEFAGVLSL